jgi:hypothetical protein
MWVIERRMPTRPVKTSSFWRWLLTTTRYVLHTTVLDLLRYATTPRSTGIRTRLPQRRHNSEKSTRSLTCFPVQWPKDLKTCEHLKNVSTGGQKCAVTREKGRKTLVKTHSRTSSKPSSKKHLGGIRKTANIGSKLLAYIGHESWGCGSCDKIIADSELLPNHTLRWSLQTWTVKII